MAQDLGKKMCTEDISVLFEHNYGRFRAFQMAMWFNDDMFKSEFAKKLVNHATMKKESVTSDSENTLIQLAKNGSMISSSYESFFDSPWANSAQVEIEHWKLHQVKLKCKDDSYIIQQSHEPQKQHLWQPTHLKGPTRLVE
jgi:hypothetical protein